MTHPQTQPGAARRGLCRLALGAAVAASGCGGAAAPDELSELEALPTRRAQSEVPLGSYNVPVPGATLKEGRRVAAWNHLQLKFSLFGMVQPKYESQVERLAERHRGALRDRVIRVCRNTSTAELQDPDLLTLKIRLIDATQPVFEGVLLDELLLTDVIIEPL